MKKLATKIQFKAFRAWLLPFFTLLFIIAGAATPFLVSRFQDLQAEQATESRRFSSVNLTLQTASTITPALYLLNISDLNWLDYSGPTNLTADEVINITKAYMEKLAEKGLTVNYFTDFDDTQFYINVCLVADENYSSIIWLCEWHDSSDNYFNSLVDDSSGKVVKQILPGSGLRIEPMEQGRLFISAPALDGQGDSYMLVNNYQQKVMVVDGQTTTDYTAPEVIYDFTDSHNENNFPLLVKWRSFCEEYYNIQIEDVEKLYSDDCIQYTMIYQTETGAQYALPITIGTEQTTFNYP